MHLTLLLNSTYQPISFISDRKAFKLLIKGKIEVEEWWDGKIFHGKNQEIRQPAVIRLTYRVPWIPRKLCFSRYATFQRDQYLCQYCGVALTSSQITIDHIIPKALGGSGSFLNCVSSCFPCNNYKKNRTPEQAGMKLINQPKVPIISMTNDFKRLAEKHPKWEQYLF